MPTAIACGESYDCPCGAWRWVETARERGETRCSKCNRPFKPEYIGMRRLGKPGPAAKAKAKAKAASADAKAKAKLKAQAGPRRDGGGGQRRDWVDVVTGRRPQGTVSPTVRPSAPGSGDRADVLRETLALYERHGYAADRAEVQAAKAELSELLRERQARLPPAERVRAIHNKLQGLRTDLARSEESRDATSAEINLLQAKFQDEDRRVTELQSEVEELGLELAVAQRALPASQRPLPVGVRRHQGGAEDVEEDLDMALGRPEEHFLAQYRELMDDSGRHILRELTADYANKMHELAARLETNEAERRFRERKRNTEENGDDAMADVGDDSAEWQQPRRRGRTATSSPTGEAGASGGPARAPGTPAAPPADGVGTLTAGVAAGLQAASVVAAGGQAQQPASGGDGQFT